MTTTHPTFQVRAPARSMGLKLLLVCALALLMSIPALFVFALLMDRTNRAETVVSEISSLVGGPQSFAGPMLAVPYTVPPQAVPGQPSIPAQHGVYVIFPKTGDATSEAKTGVRRRGLFKATTWTADLALRSDFDLAGAGQQVPAGASLDWSRAELIVGASDARGAQADVILETPAGSLAMKPALIQSGIELSTSDPSGNGRSVSAPTSLRFFGVPAGDLAKADSKFTATARMKFAGAQRIAVLAYAQTTHVSSRGDWASPSYDGGFLPTTHNGVNDGGPVALAKNGKFQAEWQVPYIARGVSGEGTSEVLSQLGSTSLGVSLVDPANPYQAVQRSLKYALMFVGLVFLAYFLFETMQKRRVHPAQYVLLGLAQIIFYLLLLSTAERVGFDYGFLISATATVGLISAYAGWVFNSRKQGYIALASFTGLYGLIYILMRLDDWALLVGAVTSFGAIAAVMYFTRNIDWYGTDAQKAPELKEGAG